MDEPTEDGLDWIDGDMPFSTRFGDHFYAREDGRAETAHVFVGHNRLAERWAVGGDFVIAELGFGTGLNLLETWRQWRIARRAGQRLRFVSFEAYPMAAGDIRRAIGRWPDLAPLCEVLLSHWPPLSDQPHTLALDAWTELTLLTGEAGRTVPAWRDRADAWYLDGFAPARNPEMWSAELMSAVFGRTRPGGTFATYTAAGWVRRNLEGAGFAVEKVPGHGAKRAMLRGYRPRAATTR
ncbi:MULTISPECIES: tRNA (5-methylaminomethyl-2-thiouridine)(34)-methyltransferase MnmD [unclassified Roseitalea]|uniref:tRNA (5-methylaminomethyl-2-thiouridine)(34)-methyltransferase MnmD n=1 Tax=unclassified Roseitalea TaxID=2639107 RepID=UPI00273DD723|nr:MULTISPECIES: tRNA (5-methylaminomethyl-2-thiouridine)(34)-methyltransferase MnmD [unclassified Roseitalea]